MNLLTFSFLFEYLAPTFSLDCARSVSVEDRAHRRFFAPWLELRRLPPIKGFVGSRQGHDW